VEICYTEVRFMKDLNKLQNVRLDKGKLAGLIRETDRGTIKEVLQVKDSQLAYLRSGDRGPSVDGLLRLMMMYGLKPSDLVTLEK
jgi:hypothetical protein